MSQSAMNIKRSGQIFDIGLIYIVTLGIFKTKTFGKSNSKIGVPLLRVFGIGIIFSERKNLNIEEKYIS